MNPEIKAKWVEALRSGEYKQARIRLRTADGFCCLGVLCDLHARETKGEWVERRASFFYDGQRVFLPQKVADWAGLAGLDPVVLAGGRSHHLSKLNDVGTPFSAIADYIEREL